MFREAFKIAQEFTYPVVMVRKTWKGECSSSIGSFVVVNNEGWIVTAAHVLKHVLKLLDEQQIASGRETAKKAVECDPTLDAKQKQAALARLGKPNPEQTHKASFYWGIFGNCGIENIAYIDEIDLGIAKIIGFDEKLVKSYPVFKDPTMDFDQGTSLCKLGFPFHGIAPAFDAATDQFVLPAGAFPVPMFPMDGIFTRTHLAKVAAPNDPNGYPLLWLETSTPGLKGQSGGPTFDVRGAIWAIQCVTSHLALGFNPPVPGGKNGEKEHQFLNVGLGAHSKTIIGLFNQNGVKYQVSAY